jgi:hypothetical protein
VRRRRRLRRAIERLPVVVKEDCDSVWELLESDFFLRGMVFDSSRLS